MYKLVTTDNAFIDARLNYETYWEIIFLKLHLKILHFKLVYLKGDFQNCFSSGLRCLVCIKVALTPIPIGNKIYALIL